MKVTSVKLFTSNFKNSKQKGFGTVTFDDVIDVKITLVMGEDGSMFIGWPQKTVLKDGKTEYQNVVNWTKDGAATMRAEIIKAVNDEFNKIMIMKDGKIPTGNAPVATVRSGFHTIPIPSAEECPFEEPVVNAEPEPAVTTPERKKPAVVWGVPQTN